MRTPAQIKDNIAWKEIDRCRNVETGIELLIEENFHKGEVKLERLESRDVDWVLENLLIAGYRAEKEDRTSEGFGTCVNINIKWDIP
jgi:hypothetical protein